MKKQINKEDYRGRRTKAAFIIYIITQNAVKINIQVECTLRLDLIKKREEKNIVQGKQNGKPQKYQ